MNELKFQIVNGMVLQGLIGSLRVGDCNDLIDLKETMYYASLLCWWQNSAQCAVHIEIRNYSWEQDGGCNN